MVAKINQGQNVIYLLFNRLKWGFSKPTLFTHYQHSGLFLYIENRFPSIMEI